MHISHRPVLLLTNRRTLTCCICLSAVTLIDNGVAYTTHCTGKYFAIFPKYYVAVLILILFIIIVEIGKKYI